MCVSPRSSSSRWPFLRVKLTKPPPSSPPSLPRECEANTETQHLSFTEPPLKTRSVNRFPVSTVVCHKSVHPLSEKRLVRMSRGFAAVLCCHLVCRLPPAPLPPPPPSADGVVHVCLSKRWASPAKRKGSFSLRGIRQWLHHDQCVRGISVNNTCISA